MMVCLISIHTYAYAGAHETGHYYKCGIYEIIHIPMNFRKFSLVHENEKLRSDPGQSVFVCDYGKVRGARKQIFVNLLSLNGARENSDQLSIKINNLRLSY